MFLIESFFEKKSCKLTQIMHTIFAFYGKSELD